MAYQALYRKYRSQRFDEMVGQEVVATTLKNAIINHQISHAYLFSGPRGTGKTSAAKIFAKAINCPNQVDGEPCNNCFICDSITKGTLEDVIELDAASNNGVDEIREIRDKSTYAASQATYKVYIIDEVHMLSTGAFNALLKTLEEPTDNVVFVLATTELQKIPATIISRVQRFAFKAITISDIRSYLAEILAKEQLDYEATALDILAKAAEGGMRDALSLLDQALSFSNNKLTEQDALLVTGSIANQALVSYVQALQNADEEAALDELDKIFLEGKNMLRFTEDLLVYLRDCLLDKANTISHARLYAWINIAIESLKTLKETTQTKIAADVMTMRLIEAQNSQAETPASNAAASGQLAAEVAQLKAQLADLQRQLRSQPANASQAQPAAVSSVESPKVEVPAVKAKPKIKTQPAAPAHVSQDLVFKALAEATNEARQAISAAWSEVVASFSKPAERALIRNTAPVAASEHYVVVTFPHPNLAKRVMENADLQVQFGNLLSSIVGFAPEIIALAENEWAQSRAAYVASLNGNEAPAERATSDLPAPPEDEGVQLAKEMFGDKVIEIDD